MKPQRSGEAARVFRALERLSRAIAHISVVSALSGFLRLKLAGRLRHDLKSAVRGGHPDFGGRTLHATIVAVGAGVHT